MNNIENSISERKRILIEKLKWTSFLEGVDLNLKKTDEFSFSSKLGAIVKIRKLF